MFAYSSSSPIVGIAWMLIHSIWQGAILWLIYRLVRMTIRDAAWCVHLGHATLLLLVVCQCITFAHIMNADEPTTAPIQTKVTLAELAKFHADAQRLPLPRLAPTERIGTWIAAHERYLPWVVAVWLLGLLLQLGKTLGAYYLLQRHLNKCPNVEAALRGRFSKLATDIGLRQSVKFLMSDLVLSPATARWIKPVVLVPAAALLQLQPWHVEAYILHELAHIKRWDYATNILRTFVAALYFFHPLVRDICGRTSDDAERATDALAAKTFNDQKGYSEAFIELADWRARQPREKRFGVLSSGGGDLRERIIHMLRQQSLPAVDARSRASLAGTLLSVLVGVVLLISATAWATHSREVMNRVTQQTYEEIVVESLSHRTTSDAFTVPLDKAIAEIDETDSLSIMTAQELTDALLDGVDPHVLYRRFCEYPGEVDFDLIRNYSFGPFGHGRARYKLVEKMISLAEHDGDPARMVRMARATLVFASLMVPTDGGSSASALLRDPKFIVLLNLSREDRHLLELTAAVTFERTQRLGDLIAAERRNPKGATDEQIEAFAAELPYMPSFQLTLCSKKMSLRFQRRVLAVLKRDESKYPPGSVLYALEHAARE